MSVSSERAAELAQEFHERYERLAPDFSYETRRASAVPWEKVPDSNRRLMIAVCQPIADRLEAAERERDEAWAAVNDEEDGYVRQRALRLASEARLKRLEEALREIAAHRSAAARERTRCDGSCAQEMIDTAVEALTVLPGATDFLYRDAVGSVLLHPEEEGK